LLEVFSAWDMRSISTMVRPGLVSPPGGVNRDCAAVVFIPGTDKAMTAIPYVGMVTWMALAIISFFGYVPEKQVTPMGHSDIVISLVACWKQHTKLVGVFFWLLLAHYIVDLGLLVANIVVAHESARQTLDACQERIRQDGITGDTGFLCTPISASAVLFLSILGVYKLVATCMSHS
jgi:hypothetical protein